MIWNTFANDLTVKKFSVWLELLLMWSPRRSMISLGNTRIRNAIMMTMRVRVILLLLLLVAGCTLKWRRIWLERRRALIREELQILKISIGIRIPKMALAHMNVWPIVLLWSSDPMSMMWISSPPRSNDTVLYVKNSGMLQAMQMTTTPMYSVFEKQGPSNFLALKGWQITTYLMSASTTVIHVLVNVKHVTTPVPYIWKKIEVQENLNNRINN